MSFRSTSLPAFFLSFFLVPLSSPAFAADCVSSLDANATTGPVLVSCIQEMQDEIDVLTSELANASSAAFPTGSVLAFDLPTCPSGWDIFEPAQGRFIRGIDATLANDVFRAPGHIQEDAFQGHFHAMDPPGGAPGLFDSTVGTGPQGRPAVPKYDITRPTFRVLGPMNGRNGEIRVADETRPKNVALLICRHQ